MFLSFGVLVDALLFVLGCFWCIHTYHDLPKHLKEIRSTNPKTEKWPALFVLGLSLLILLWMIGFARRVLGI